MHSSNAWRSADFQLVGHIVFSKSYSSKSRFFRYEHEQAFLLAKGRPPLPKQPLGDVMGMPYSGTNYIPLKSRYRPWCRSSAALLFLERPYSTHSREVEAHAQPLH
jgi:hypothetical protein